MRLNQKGALDILVLLVLIVTLVAGGVVLYQVTSNSDDDSVDNTATSQEEEKNEEGVQAPEDRADQPSEGGFEFANLTPENEAASVLLQRDLSLLDFEDITEELSLAERDSLRATIANIYVFELERYYFDNGNYPDFPDFDDVFDGVYVDEDYDNAFQSRGATGSFGSDPLSQCPPVAPTELTYIIDTDNDSGQTYDVYNCLESGDHYLVRP